MFTQVLIHFLGQTFTLSFPTPAVLGLAIKHEISRRFLQKIPHTRISLIHDGKPFHDEASLHCSGSLMVRATLHQAICGGKGGFGAILRYLPCNIFSINESNLVLYRNNKELNEPLISEPVVICRGDDYAM